MSLYQAFVLTGRTTFGGGAARVFLIRKDDAGFDLEKLSEVREWLATKYLQDLKPTDLEVIEVDGLKDRLKQLNGRPKPKKT